MKPLLITGGTIYTESGELENGYLIINGQQIAEVGKGADAFNREDYDVHVLPAKWSVVPGMIDLHIHGAAGADVMDGTVEALKTMAVTLPQEGTTSFLATTMTQGEEEIESALQNVREYMGENNPPGEAEIIGLHLEGPFISPKRAGAQPLDHIKNPDVELFQKWQELSGNAIKLVTLAPEEPGGYELSSYLKETGVVASIGHSDALYEEVVKGIDSGVTHATHLYNGMRGLHHREPGVAGAVLLHDEITTEIIVDGIHSRPEMVKFAYRNKGSERVVLITDSMRAKCMGNGFYTLGGQGVTVNGNEATLADGTLAGSILKMKDAARNMREFTGCSTEDIIQMTAVNQAKELGVFERKGSLSAGKDADVVVLNEEKEVMYAFCRGKLSYQQKEGENRENN
ncbi:N-acetylglucosamine-6-phosphate deacetylase [Fictibacillus terranigra]|uniref:N-acetylglucosamine-6-phosphate deacetylase n=1 Tax=Fictibacillus terranigra TaxID=3058424 RepID=A0ABT8E3J7_9BACL|nr:N-acetylglucosamine-6-phosphate deacetylase [Fictibacillus sp. CENA-BCM004]MDN4072483.1 N-acetylglucosamine-6-phosphate deacetylase [Fictibacillus sp. CENA-BCM004]